MRSTPGVLQMSLLYHVRPRGTVTSYTDRPTVLDATELGTALLCACLPLYRPLLPDKLPLSRRAVTWMSPARNARKKSMPSDILELGQVNSGHSSSSKRGRLHTASGEREDYHKFASGNGDRSDFMIIRGGEDAAPSDFEDGHSHMHPSTGQDAINIV